MREPEPEPLSDAERDTLHRMAHQVDEIHRMLSIARPLFEAWQRGGMIAARTAAKRLGRAVP